MSLRKRDLDFEIEYPETDGEPMAETDIHAQLMMDLRFSLSEFFRDDPKVYVSSNLFIYYVEGDPRKRVAPDVFVVRGAGKRIRRIYKLWEEKLPPDIVFEISSRKTWREDMYEKWRLYEHLGVKEYFIFDPEYDYLIEPLIGWRLIDGRFQPLNVEDGRVRSEVLELDLVDTGETLRLLNSQTGEFLLTPAEEAVARRVEMEGRLRAEAETERLRIELAQLRQGPP
jgi:Uma2 family endonuclease